MESADGRMGPTAPSQPHPGLSKDRGTRGWSGSPLPITQVPHRARAQVWGAPGRASCGRPLFSGSPHLSVWPSSVWSPVGCQLELVISSCLPGTDSSLCHFPGSPHISSSLTTHSLESQKTATDSKTNKEYQRAALYSGKWQLKGALRGIWSTHVPKPRRFLQA